MIDFIIENKEWLFSGIGVSILTAVFLLLRSLVLRRKNRLSYPINQEARQSPDSQTTSQEKDTIGYSTHPTPKEIANEISKLAPFQQTAAENNYIGLKVRWDVSLSLVHLRDNNQVQLSCEFKGYSRYVEVETNLEDYPEIKIVKRGQIITVYGVIKGIHPSGPQVEAHKLEFI